MNDIDHLTAGPWHHLTVGGTKYLTQALSHPQGCPDRCRIGRLLIADTPGQLPATTAGLDAGRYRLRWSGRGVDIQHADGTDIPGRRRTPPDPLSLTRAELEALGEVANEALNAYHHADQCGCDLWPQTCATPAYRPGMWDTSAWYPALPAILAAWAQLRPSTPPAANTAQENT